MVDHWLVFKENSNAISVPLMIFFSGKLPPHPHVSSVKSTMKEVSKGVVLRVAVRKESTGHHRAAKASRKGREESCSRKGPRKADFEHVIAC